MDVQEVLVEGDLAVWQELAERIAANHPIEILKKSETCLVMAQATDSVGDTPFYLGEVLITEAAVAIHDVTGYGYTIAEDPVRALCMAVIHSALAAGLPETAAILAAVEAEKKRLQAKIQQENELVAGTKVRFAIMEG